jgi:hypothetical protein
MSFYPDIECWSDEHMPFMFMGANALFFYAGLFYAACIYWIFQYPKKVRDGDVLYLLQRRFLFQRFTKEAYWFAAVLLMRSAALTMMPIIFTSTAILLPMAGGTLLTYYTFVHQFSPWRIKLVNLLDEILVADFILLVILAAMVTTVPGDHPDIQFFLLIALGLVILAIFGGTFGLLVAKFAPRPKQFDIFVSHHKLAAGALARELNLLFSVYCRWKVFIDCDDLQDLHKLATTVEKDVRCMFVLGTKEVLTRPWCLAEVVIAVRHHIPMVLCQVNGCTPKFEFDVADIDDAMKSFLTSVNIDPQEVKDSFKALERAPRVQYNTYATDSDRAEQLTAMLRASGTVGSKVKVAEDPMYLRKNPGVEEKKKAMTLVTTSGKRVEAIAAARILVHFIRERDTQAWVYDLVFEVGNLPLDNTTGNSRNSTAPKPSIRP